MENDIKKCKKALNGAEENHNIASLISTKTKEPNRFLQTNVRTLIKKKATF